MKMNVALLRKIQDKIRDVPGQFIMTQFFTNQRGSFGRYAIPNCGTAACIAGWAYTLHKETNPKKAWDELEGSTGGLESMGAEILGLNLVQAQCLFYESSWPKQFRSDEKDRSSDEYLKDLPARAIARIEHLIQTGE